MFEPLVTVGIPFYNNKDTLLDAIKSIFAQSFQDWELILIDDGSTDKSLEIAHSINDPRVKVISDGKNEKLPARLNQIIDLAHGKYIARMDADDLCSPTRIKKQLELFDEDPSLDVVGTSMVYLGENDVPLGYCVIPTSHSEICKEPHRTFSLCHATVLAKKSWYEANLYDENVALAQDFNLWLGSYINSKFSNVAEPLYYFRCEDSFSHRKRFRDRSICAKFLFKHYQKQHQFIKAVYATSMQYIKLIVGLLICVIWSKRKLLERRYQPLSSNEVKLYQEEIEKIKGISLPVFS